MPKDSKSKKVTSQDVPGIGKKGGSARSVARKIEARKRSSQSAMEAARSILMRNQSTDKHQ